MTMAAMPGACLPMQAGNYVERGDANICKGLGFFFYFFVAAGWMLSTTPSQRCQKR